MQSTFKLIELTQLGIIVAAFSVAGCAAHQEATHSLDERVAVYETAEQIKGMEPCRAKVIERGPCYLQLQARDGGRFCVGGPGSEAIVSSFLGTLKEGESYDLPETFMKYLASNTSQTREPPSR